MTMNDSGLGRSEVIRLRPKDYKFDEDPVRIVTQRFKTGEHIETFITNETAATTKQLITNRNIKPDNYIFVKRLGSRGADKFAEAYIKALRKAGLDQRLEVRIGDQVREHNYFKFHLHIYRKRWFTKAINVVPAYVAHTMLGRKQYLDQYLAHPLSERQTFYKKIAKHVGIFENKTDKQEIAEQVAKTLGIDANGIDEEKLKALSGLFGKFMTLPADKIDKITRLLSD